jgi:hypothetical protein
MAHARFYRLYFEIFNRATSTRVSVLLAANSRKQMEIVAGEMDHLEHICDVRAIHCASFPEACTVSVEIRVRVNEKETSLIWGSLLQSVTGEHPQRVQLKRLYEGRLKRVSLNAEDGEALRLPLLPGDDIKWD